MNRESPAPVIGILTARKANGSIGGNGPLFIAIQKKLISLNGIGYVFIPDEVEEDSIIGYTYSFEDKCWKKERFPYPDLVYNRIPFRKAEQSEEYQHFFAALQAKGIPYFNPCFIDKYELHTLLNEHATLQTFTPRTILVQEQKQLFSFFQKFNTIYLKPRQAAKGKGIVRVKSTTEKALHVEGVKQQEVYPTFQDFWDEWKNNLLTQSYLAQEAIDSAEHEGKRFDFRILAHADHDHYTLTGVGIRQAQEQEVTTHIPAGGRLLPYPSLQSSVHDQFIRTIIPQLGQVLSDRFGYFGEFSIDAGVSKQGKYYIYEVNSKPMSFDEPEIEERKIDRLCRLFLQLTGRQI